MNIIKLDAIDSQMTFFERNFEQLVEKLYNCNCQKSNKGRGQMGAVCEIRNW
jgi:hypothetical protein